MMTEEIDKTPQIDPEAIRKHCELAHANPLRIATLNAWMKQDEDSFRKHIGQFIIPIEPGYLCCYQIEEVPSGRLQVHFSVRSQFDLDINVVEKIASAFGLGDRSQWTIMIPPSPPLVSGYHIMKSLPPKGSMH